jgi:DNA (cytosine-5)-methyltransferase 1
MVQKLTAVSLFSGCGGFDLGIKQAGVEIIWANDNDRYAASAYRSLFPEVEFHLDDIRNINEFPTADILIGCYPCTGFSLAARRRWKDRDERDLKKNPTNHLFREFLRVIGIVKPKYLFVENVRGMRSASEGWFLDEQIEGFESLGYRVVRPKLLDATGYGVAQSRKRIFIVGIRKDLEFTYHYPQPTFGPRLPCQLKTLADVIGGMDEWPKGEFLDYKFHGHYLTRNRKRGWEQPSYTIVADAHHVPLHPMGEPMKNVAKDQWELQGHINRRLSWRECALIQGLPVDIYDGSLLERYRVIGNAVPPALAEVLIEPILAYEFGI